MARHIPLLKRLIRFGKQLRAQRTAGFTLLELLVSIIIAALITLLLMGLVIDLAEANQRDASRSQVQQDMQTAIDYMVQDLREAVFVYNGKCLAESDTLPSGARCPGLVNHIPADLSAGRTPILAFWRTESLPDGIIDFCSDNVEGLAQGDEDNPVIVANLGGVCIAGKTYALVVYTLDPINDGTWAGQARLRRFKLSRFKDSATSGAISDQIPGYVDPLREPTLTFQQWPLDKAGASEQASLPNLNDSPAPVLLDFVSGEGTFTASPTCRDFVDPTSPTAAIDLPKALSPLGAPNPSFYVCVRGGGLTATPGQNQEVLLSLTGNLTGKPGYSRGEGPKVDPIQTRVLVRGVTQK